MKSSPSHFLPPAPARERGSALVTVIMFTLVLVILAGSVMRWAMTERQLNSRAAYWMEARNASEAVSEYGCYQVAQAFATKMNPDFSAAGTPITFPSSLADTFFSGSNVDKTSIELKAGAITYVPAAGTNYFIDPNDPNNKFDPLSGRWVLRRDVTLLSKVTVKPKNNYGRPVTSYIMQKASVRGASLLAYAVFYSGNDLEVNPLPNMDIYGPVHVNGHLFIGAVSNGVNINFHGPVTVAGHVFHAWRGTSATAQEGGTTMSATSGVSFATEITGNTLFNMRTSGGTWNDSTMGASNNVAGINNLLPLVTAARSAQFSQYASKNWKGFLQTAAMGIQSYNPMGFGEVVAKTAGGADILGTDDIADDGANVGTGAGYGHGYGPHSLIEPPLTVPATDTYYSAKSAIEETKFSRKAGLYVKVQVDASNNLVGAITLYGDPNSAPSGTPAANIGPNKGIKLGTVPSNVFQYVKYVKNGSNQVTSGIYDNRQNKGVNLVQINMGALKTALTEMASGGAGVAGSTIYAADNTTKWGAGTGYDAYKPGSTGWNGGIYVDVSSASTTADTALLLANGWVDDGQSLIPTTNSEKGLTIATNAPAYILGHFNANGDVGTSGTSNSAAYPDDTAGGTAIGSSKQAPTAIAADTVTVLSPNYFGTSDNTNGKTGTKLAPASNTSGTSAYNSYTTVNPTASSSTEIAAALISGSNTTSATSTGTQEYSGGVHNLPRFLENWGNGTKTVAIRGSLISMYNTRVATGLWGSDYYSPPKRQWGFDQQFAAGYYPPLIPRVLSYRRVDFSYIANATAYAAEVSKL